MVSLALYKYPRKKWLLFELFLPAYIGSKDHFLLEIKVIEYFYLKSF